MTSSPVTVRRESVVIPTYEPLPPDKNPMFLERRVYQGSSGSVYPLPFYNRISEKKCDHAWDAVYIENAWIRLMVLPEIGGRIHLGQDKTNGYHFFYHQGVIKPALVGLAGPWCSGGVEFNWPQHHRPATFMKVNVEIEEHADGSKTIWMSDHDPMLRMKGMHGVCLHPDRAVVELKMRAYNRTPHVQTFLWWANVATRVHEAYQSFFPPDVSFVADHARRAMSTFPLCHGQYYGVDYAERAMRGVPAADIPLSFIPPRATTAGEIPGVPDYEPNDLSWYANIPVPTSYMCLGSKEDFSGGYDYFKQAGLIQIANHHIAPGKKQWTWGNHDFGYAWDRNLTDEDGPYIELMLGVYTDNQPDFSFLQPGETKAWSVYWYPIQKIGPASAANEQGAISLKRNRSQLSIGVAVTRPRKVVIELHQRSRHIQTWEADLAPDRPWLTEVKIPLRTVLTDLRITVKAEEGADVVSYQPQPENRGSPPAPATEPAFPEEVNSIDELYLNGLHLSQYRHATRSPVPYWKEALRRDPGDSRCNTALGVWHLRRGGWTEAKTHLQTAIDRLTFRNANPYDGEAFYQLGLVCRFEQNDDEAYDAFYKATWNEPWQSASFHALAEIDAVRQDWAKALEHLNRSLVLNTDNLRARNLRVLALRRLNRAQEAEQTLRETLAIDRLDAWARLLAGEPFAWDAQTSIDVALDCARAGLFEDSISILEKTEADPFSGAAPLIQYYLSSFYEKIGRLVDARSAARRARQIAPDYCFPARLEEIALLNGALTRDPSDARAAYYLGNLYYDRRRYAEAIRLWEKSARLDPSFSVTWRNLGIAYLNVRGDARKAQAAYDRAIKVNPVDPRLVYERDQLWKRLGVAVKKRLTELEKRRIQVDQRDDAILELCSLYNQTGQPKKALQILQSRRFQPWEGGEGQSLAAHVRTHVALGREALKTADGKTALTEFTAALNPPANLGEARHLLANQSDVWFWLGEAYAAINLASEARLWWQRAAAARGDFQEMSVKAYSEMTYFSALALQRLGHSAASRKLLKDLSLYARDLARKPATIDYFATSLPTMLLFEDDLTRRQQTTALFLQAQAALGLKRKSVAKKLLIDVLERDPSHAGAADFISDIK